MGCDIHPRVEVRQGDEWIGVGEGPVLLGKRDYQRFALLSGGEVRARDSRFDGILPKPRGWPPPHEGFDHDGNHSASWLTCAELMEAVMHPVVQSQPFGFADTLATIAAEVLALSPSGNPEDVRILFDFDN